MRVAVTVTMSDDTTSVDTFSPEIGRAFGAHGFRFVTSESAPDAPVARTAIFETDLPRDEIPGAVERAVRNTNERVADTLDTTVESLEPRLELIDFEVLSGGKSGVNVAAVGLLGLGAMGLVAVLLAGRRGRQTSGLRGLTRDEIKRMFKVDARRGAITSPGKFEGEALYVPHFWDEVLQGGCQEVDTPEGVADVCEVLSDDRREFPELRDVAFVGLVETDEGFVAEVPIDPSDVQEMF